MPLYEYECEACGHRFETIQKFSDPLVDKCPRCGQTVRKLIASPAIQFKGSGWYITDYARKDSQAKGKREGAATESGTTATDEKTQGEKKPAADSSASTSTPAASPDAKKS